MLWHYLTQRSYQLFTRFTFDISELSPFKFQNRELDTGKISGWGFPKHKTLEKVLTLYILCMYLWRSWKHFIIHWKNATPSSVSLSRNRDWNNQLEISVRIRMYSDFKSTALYCRLYLSISISIRIQYTRIPILNVKIPSSWITTEYWHITLFI